MTHKAWVIDTDVLVDYLRGLHSAVKFLEEITDNSVCHITTITIAELFAGVRDGKEREVLDQFIREFQIAHLTESAAQKGGLYRRDYGKSHGVGLADAIIAATVQDLGATLATLNSKHYPMLKTIHVPYQKKNGKN